MRIATIIGSAAALATILVMVPAAAAQSAAPTMYYSDHPVPSAWVATPLPDMHFSWTIQWDAQNTTAYLIGTFNYTAGDVYVSVGTKSESKMDGLCVVCYVSSSSTTCSDWMGDGYDFERTSSLTTVVSSYRSGSGGPSQVVFSRVVYQNGVDLGVAAWGTPARVIWAWGPMKRNKPGTHPGVGIAASLIDFKTGQVMDKANPNTHLIPVYVFLAYLVVFVIVVAVLGLLNIQVHHHVRTAAGFVNTVVFFGLWVWYIVASEADYTAMGRLLPIASAMGDAAAVSLGALLVSGSRRFIGQDLLTVSHERMMLYHMFFGVTFLAAMLGHAGLMVQMFTGLGFVFRWSSSDRFANLPGTLSGFLILIIMVTSLLRHKVSYRVFRYTHVLWVPITIFVILHVPRLLWAVLPGLVLLGLNLVFGRIANACCVIEGYHYDQASGVVVLDISRRCFGPFTTTGDCKATGMAPGQWFYLGNFSWSLLWHPISVARSSVRDGRQYMRFLIKDTRNDHWTSDLAHTADQSSEPTQLQQATDGAEMTERAAQPPPLPMSPQGAAATLVEDGRHPQMKPAPPTLQRTWLEGPFGRQELNLKAYPRLVFVAGGIGVTPHLHSLQYVAEYATQCRQANQRVPWTHVVWLWSVREPSLLALVRFDLGNYAEQLLAAGVRFECRVYCTATKEGSAAAAEFPNSPHGRDSTIQVCEGRPALKDELATMSQSDGAAGCVGAFGCGSTSLADDMKAACGWGSGFHLHVEVYEV